MKQAQDIPTARVLLLGDAGAPRSRKAMTKNVPNPNFHSAGVGKSRLADLLASSVDTPTPSTRTVGNMWWNVQVRLHEYPSRSAAMPPTPEWTSQSSDSPERMLGACNNKQLELNACDMDMEMEMLPYFVEFYDLKSSMRLSHEHRNRLYRHIDGIILVYDLLDMRTHDNLHDWLYQPLRQICRYRHRRLRPILRRRHVPILVVGTKLDLLASRRPLRAGRIAHQLRAEELLLNCLDASSLTARPRNVAKLQRFLQTALDFKQYFPAHR
ncbi:hypothetical protein KR222_011430 [Zaprionus bogoriensis]|nr:hypothetical protein KR222_011430 [Zaprionus bogoriensis]